MANHKSAEKRVRQTKTRTLRNKVQKSKAKTYLKEIREAFDKNDTANLEALFKKTQSTLAKLSGKGVFKKNKIARLVSRLQTKVNAQKAQ